MKVGIAEAKNRLPKLLRLAEAGEEVVITRRGKPVARIAALPAAKRKVQLGWARGSIRYTPGWDKPITEEEFIRGKW